MSAALYAVPVYHSPAAVVWAAPGCSLTIMWTRPGGRLYIGQCLVAGGSITTIDHPTANAHYTTLKAAGEAVAAFLEAR